VGCGIYEIICVKNGWTTYVGQSGDIEKRWRYHRSVLRGGYHYNAHLQRAWDKYGEESFLFEVVEYCSLEALAEREQFWLDGIRQLVPVFNVGKCADCPVRGQHHTPEAKAKISAALMGNTHGLGKHHTPETKAKIGAGRRGRHHTSEAKAKISAALMGHKGVRHTPEAKAKISAANAKPYPSFIHEATGRVIPAGRDLKKMCREHPDMLERSSMWRVAHGKLKSHKGWRLLENQGMEFHVPGPKPYPAFVHEDGCVIPAGVNLKKLCREHGLHPGCMRRVICGTRHHHHGWKLA